MIPPTQIDTEHAAGAVAVRPLRLLLVAAFAALLVLAGVDQWWMLALAAVAAPLGLTGGGARLGVVAMAVAAGVGAFAVLIGWADLRDALVTAARGVVTGVLPWSVAIAWRVRRAGEADAALAMLRDQEAQRMRAETDLARQRLQLAESLHDDLGHALSLVAVNLGRLELELERDLEAERRPHASAAARESVGLARSQVSDAVARLGASVQTLRTSPAERAPDAPSEAFQPDLETLVRNARNAGADIELSGSPGPARLVAFGTAVSRVVQEGLTNALKHAPGRPVRVALDAGPGRLVVTVRNPLPEPPNGSPPADMTAPSPSVGGTGVMSLTEYVRAAGGSVEAGPAHGEYVLRAELLPLDGPPRGPSPGHQAGLSITGNESSLDASTVTHGLVRARRRGGALLLAAVLAPAVALVAVATAIQLSDRLDARRALLDPEAFAQISVGDSRFEVRRLLPPAALQPPSGADPSCEYYTVTADPLADASGDAYRICWADGRVTSADVVVGGAQ
ncbi:hypothetical protein [Promicromonospora sp. NPDC050249]|uniref:sensor histidine kinase n=1 Tax=Promicromonospora sp. NPDC050249 TaxID=3154743 RepID=UPI0033EAF29F